MLWRGGFQTLLTKHRRWPGKLSTTYNFTSAIHSAVKSPVNPHLTAAIAGELAEAMYGCEQGFLKRKYTDRNFFMIVLPDAIEKKYEKELEFIRNHRYVSFFQKNDARTNVERHVWTPIRNIFEGKVMSHCYFQSMMKAFYTDWENRYGFYLDNGWFYVYRSYYLICRFKVRKNEQGEYIIYSIQQSDENIDPDIAMITTFAPSKLNLNIVMV